MLIVDIFFNIQRAILFHSIIRWAVLVLAVLVILITIYKMVEKHPFSAIEDRFSFWYALSIDIMLLLGIVLWVWGDLGLKLIEQNGLDVVMHDKQQRFFAIEHPIMMLAAVICIHIGRIGLKNSLIPYHKKHIRLLVWSVISFLLILFAIPWYLV